jgi:hypothetical protein
MKLANAAVATMLDKDLPHALMTSGPAVSETIMISFAT